MTISIFFMIIVLVSFNNKHHISDYLNRSCHKIKMKWFSNK